MCRRSDVTPSCRSISQVGGWSLFSARRLLRLAKINKDVEGLFVQPSHRTALGSACVIGCILCMVGMPCKPPRARLRGWGEENKKKLRNV